MIRYALWQLPASGKCDNIKQPKLKHRNTLWKDKSLKYEHFNILLPFFVRKVQNTLFRTDFSCFGFFCLDSISICRCSPRINALIAGPLDIWIVIATDTLAHWYSHEYITSNTGYGNRTLFHMIGHTQALQIITYLLLITNSTIHVRTGLKVTGYRYLVGPSFLVDYQYDFVLSITFVNSQHGPCKRSDVRLISTTFTTMRTFIIETSVKATRNIAASGHGINTSTVVLTISAVVVDRSWTLHTATYLRTTGSSTRVTGNWLLWLYCSRIECRSAHHGAKEWR